MSRLTQLLITMGASIPKLFKLWKSDTNPITTEDILQSELDDWDRRYEDATGESFIDPSSNYSAWRLNKMRHGKINVCKPPIPEPTQTPED